MTRVAVATDAAVRTLVSFAPPLPASISLSGAWLDNTTLVIALAGVTPSVQMTPGMAVGVLAVQILPAGGLRSAVGQSAASNSSGVVASGTW